ncbi:hypothetical protein [Oceanobacillus bengalensis]|uniref:Uncharacterized protein n=1 Tax=Oceanobacillus bengalensis TaxID=1435466 RepID=A0A494Z806_9BACI|nr:hypothetical protein [Oceanobacillus bengalensis]RKQ18725.1 hypothetical protein D8M05_01035 [Oceanobacillus bengalensis]
METLADTVWTMYIVVLIIALASSIMYWIYRRFSALAVITIILSLLIPLVAFIYYAQRPWGMDEYVFLKEQLQMGDNWAIFLTSGYIYLIAWLVLLMVDFCIYLCKLPSINRKFKILWRKCSLLAKKVFVNISVSTKEILEKVSVFTKNMLDKLKEKIPMRKKIEDKKEKEKVGGE